jgi:phosphatidylethanolamine/phosphatidyl-N-methylethanolamine N-methyltransferase
MTAPQPPRRTSLASMNGLRCALPQSPTTAEAPNASDTQAMRCVVDAYARFAPLYDKLFGAVLEPGRRAMTRAARALEPESVLEVGVGTGLTLHGYPERARVVGIDVSQQMLQQAQRRAAEMPERDISLHLMSAEQMPFADDSFDCVTVPYVLSVTPNPAQLVREVRRVCRKGGTILIVNHFSGSRLWLPLEWAVRPLADRIGFRSELSFDEHISAHDWHIESMQRVNLLGLSRLIVLRNERQGSGGAAERETISPRG